MSEHKHSIMIIRNKEGEYLNYFDNRWNSYLFLNSKIYDYPEENTETKYIADKLNIAEKNIDISMIYEKIHTKYSESAKKNKEYHHYFYNVLIKQAPHFFTKKEFTINEIKYRWFSMKELQEDKRIQKVNSDIVEIVKELRGE